MPWAGFVKPFNIMKVKIIAKCVSKKEKEHYDEKNPILTIIELDIPYNEDGVFNKTQECPGLLLKTENKEAANMFEIGKNYYVSISPNDD